MYASYTNFIQHVVNQPVLDFKSHPAYTTILEHLDAESAREQVRILNDKGVSDMEISEFTSLNDALGNPTKRYINKNISCSPTSIRYVYHSHLILEHFSKFSNEIDIVELGGGYGGLCVAILAFAPKFNIKIKSYTIIDLTEPIALQKRYLREIGVSGVKFINADTYGKGVPSGSYLISNYAFSEFDAENRAKYQKVLFPNISHGFMAWNFIPLYDFGFQVTAEPEVPQTGGSNQHVYF